MADAASQERALGPHRGASAPCARVRSFRCLPERALRRLWPEPWGRTRALPHGAEPLRPAPASTAAALRAAPHLPAPCTGPALRGAAEPTGAHLGLQEPGHVRGRFPLISGSLGSFHQVKHVDTEMTVATGNSHSWTPRREARHLLGALGEASRVGDVHRALTGFLGRKGAGIGLAHVGAAAVGAGLSQVSGICPGD